MIILGATDGADSSPTFTRDVAPILFTHCVSCHRPKEIGPFSLMTYQDAKKRAKQLARITAKRIMPPWLPHSEWGDFKEARTLTAREIAVFQQWLDNGTPKGDPSDLPTLSCQLFLSSKTVGNLVNPIWC